MDLSSILLATAILTSTLLSTLSYIPPNPNPPASESKDTASLLSGSAVVLPWLLSTTSIGIAHCFIILFPVSASSLCPNPERLNPALFTWSPVTVGAMGVILICAPLRLISFRNLGPNFTYRIAPPKKLVTSGIYRYIQHPSYTGIVGVVAANGCLMYRPDGVPACWVGEGIQGGMWWVMAGCLVVGFVLLGGRVRDEEVMLKESFESEWEVWSGRTRRFVPGLF